MTTADADADGTMASACCDNVLRLKRTDHKTKRVLLNVHREGESSDTLDLKLIGTDFEFVYAGEIAQSSLKSLQSSKFTGKLDEWRTVLEYVLLHRRPRGLLPDILDGLEVVTAITKQILTVTIRKNISGIRQTLGTIQLVEDTENIEIATLDWVDCAVANSDELRAQLQTAQQQANNQQVQIANLNAELDRLIGAKKQHEEEMLSKFAALLNAKKSKIRDQQRLLAGARIGSDAVDEAGPAASSVSKSSRRAGTSRKGKRKANGTTEPESEQIAQENNARIENSTEDEEDERRRQDTPETGEESEDEDASDTKGDVRVMANAASKSQTTRRVASHRSQGHPQGTQKMVVDSKTSPSPSRRKLPHRKTKSPSKEPTPPPETSKANDEDDDETEDEL